MTATIAVGVSPSPGVEAPTVTTLDRLYGRLARNGECWEWQGRRGHMGHGIAYANGRPQLAHRVIWEDLRGPIPDGLELDHLCRNPPCCNPDHLDPVTHAENMRRGIQSFDTRARCLSGLHPLTPDTVLNRADGRQQCRVCKKAAKERRKARQRALGIPVE